jgi:class 3 adenylate cyclase
MPVRQRELAIRWRRKTTLNAARAAFSIQRALAELNRKNADSGKPTLNARIGIETGPVMVDAGEIYGDTPNTAAQVSHARGFPERHRQRGDAEQVPHEDHASDHDCIAVAIRSNSDAFEHCHSPQRAHVRSGSADPV